MQKLAILIISVIPLSACGGPGGEIGIRESGASGAVTVFAEYVPLAECTKDALERKEWGYIRTVLVPSMSLLTHRNEAKLRYPENAQAMQYLIDIRGEGSQSSVEVFAEHLGWMYTDQGMVDELLDVVKGCAA